MCLCEGRVSYRVGVSCLASLRPAPVPHILPTSHTATYGHRHALRAALTFERV